MDVKAYAVMTEGGSLEPITIQRREPGAEEVLVELLFCGICHTDLVVANNESKQAEYPVVPGHEMVGRVAQVGPDVSKVAVGDIVGIGCIADSCRHCGPCDAGDEHYCDSGFVMTFNSTNLAGEKTNGGYSSHYTIHQHYLVKIPTGLDPAGAAPLLCGGITVYTPLKRFGAGPGLRVGVAGLGGLGHLAVKMASAMGATTAVLTGSPGKTEDARRLGADEVVLTSDESAMATAAGSFDLIINSISGLHDVNAYLPLLSRKGTLCYVGAPQAPMPLVMPLLIFGDKVMAGSLIGGIPSTEEMLAFCAEHQITADIEMITIDGVNEAWDRLENNDVKYRFVIDLASLH